MINSATYSIKEEALLPWVQYILFNQGDRVGQQITSFGNTNICLGILNDSKLVKTNTNLINEQHSGIHAYVSGMYLNPHNFMIGSELDEVCIDFTPIGFYYFFPFAQKKYILEEDVLREGFGPNAIEVFEYVFSIDALQQRGQIIEQFLLAHLRAFEDDFLHAAIHFFQSNPNTTVLNALKYLHCSERKLQRAFISAFDITPKQFLRIARFRRTLLLLHMTSPKIKLSDLAYQCGYSDQSHMIREIRYFTGKSPSHLISSLLPVDDKVLVILD